MTDPDSAPVVTDECAPDRSAEPAGDGPGEIVEDGARGAIPDDTLGVAIDLVRARKLGRRLRIEVAIDRTHRLRREVELVFTRKPDGTLGPVTVRVGREASDDDVLADGGVVARCEQYNAALGRLRQLAAQLTEAVRDARVALVPGSPIAYAHRELAQLDELIERRLRSTLSRGAVRTAILVREIEFFARCDAHLTPILRAAMRPAHANAKRAGSLVRRARRWLRW
jgi:hypothetical protein